MSKHSRDRSRDGFKWVWEDAFFKCAGDRITASHRAVLWAIFKHWDSRGEGAFAGYERLARYANVTKQTAIAAVRQAEREGWLVVLQRGSGRKRMNIYQAEIPFAIREEIEAAGPKRRLNDAAAERLRDRSGRGQYPHYDHETRERLRAEDMEEFDRQLDEDLIASGIDPQTGRKLARREHDPDEDVDEPEKPAIAPVGKRSRQATDSPKKGSSGWAERVKRLAKGSSSFTLYPRFEPGKGQATVP